MERKEHLTMGREGLQRILENRASMNWGLTDQLKVAFPHIIPGQRPLIDNKKMLDPYWLAGFVSAEGCFVINIRKSKTHRLGFQIQLRFKLSQHCKDEILIKSLIEYFNCGSIYKTGEYCSYEVVKLSDIDNKILPFFTKFRIVGVKALDFSDFCRVVELMKEGRHLTNEGLKQIRHIKYGMNRGRKLS